MTISEKILASHSGRNKVEPGEFVMVDLDLALGNDITAPLAIEIFKSMGKKSVFDPHKIILVADHNVPNRDVKSALQVQLMRRFAREQGIESFFDIGESGIEHVLLPEKGLVLPGDLVIGADSHTCTYGALGAFATGVGSTDLAVAMATGQLWLRVPETLKFIYSGSLEPWVCGKDLILYTIGLIGADGALYKAMEFTGEVISKLSMESRLTMSNMAIEAGAKNGIIEPDEITLDYIKNRASREYKIFKSDDGALFKKVYEIDVTEIEPQVALPYLPSNVKPVREVGQIPLDQVVIGSCTNGKMEDLRTAATILKGRKKSPWLRLLIIPATQEIYRQAIREGLIEIFLDSGAAVCTPTCGPCLGAHMGVLAKGEKALATTNRNFVGRMGHSGSEVYLSNPAIAAASAILGRIGRPEDLK